ncbi:transposase [Streptosporangium sp. NPDC006013]|uniref:transposase n=1 Tax=Streptosporangium sp. NPDC006013 TaxID=3155596 RepID=UPI0033A43DF2
MWAASPLLRTPPPRSDTASRISSKNLSGRQSSAIRQHDSFTATALHFLKRASADQGHPRAGTAPQVPGVAVVYFDPAYTSQECSACGHIDKRNRPDQKTFACTSCRFAEHADVNAARNIAARGVTSWAVSHAA